MEPEMSPVMPDESLGNSIMNEDIAGLSAKSGNNKASFLEKPVPSSSIIGLAVAYLDMMYAQMKNEEKIRDEDIRQFIKDNLKEGIRDGMMFAECPSEISDYLNSAKRVLANDEIKFDTIQINEQSSGKTIIGVLESDADKLAALTAEAYKEAKSYNVDKDVLESAKTSEGTIITTQPLDLTPAQMSFMLPELSHADLLYSVDPINENLSILINNDRDRAKLKDLINKVSVDMSSTDFQHWQRVYESRSKVNLQVAQMVNSHSDKTVYISSSERIDGRYTFLKITPETVSLVTGTVSENEQEHDIRPVSDLDNLRVKLAGFEQPVVMSEEEFKEKNKIDLFKEKKALAYGDIPRDEVDKRVTDLLKCKAVRHIDYKERDMYKAWDQIKETASKSPDIDTQLKYMRVKDLEPEECTPTVSRYCTAHMHLDKVFEEPSKEHQLEEGAR